MIDIFIGTADHTVPIFIPDPASTTGVGKTGLNAAAVTVTYTRYETDNDVVHTDVTSSVNDLSALTDAHNDWGWKEVSSTLSKGQYRLDLADAVFAAGAWYAVVQVTITSGTAAATPMAFRLINRNDLTDTAQTGDSYAIVNSGTHGNAALKTLIDAVDDLVDTEVGAIKTVVDAILADTGTDGVIVASIANNAITAAAIADNAIDAGAIAADAITAAKLHADVTTELQSGLATAAALDTVDNFLDTEIAAIKAKTDSLTFTVANVLDVNIQRINDAAIVGDGSGTPFNV